MKQYILIGISIITGFFLILCSMTNVVGYQKIQYSNQQIINKEGNQQELLFQTIVDIANNKEIQQIIFKSNIDRKEFFNSDIHYQFFKPIILTKNQLKQMYSIGILFSKVISKSRMQLIFGKYHFNNQDIQKEINAVIEKNPALKGEITQLRNSECDCENNSRNATWTFPVLCTILFNFVMLAFFLYFAGFDFLAQPLATIMGTIGRLLDCWWY